MKVICNKESKWGHSWFACAHNAKVFIGHTGWEYPRSFELRPVVAMTIQTNGVNFALRLEGSKLLTEFNFNPHYYSVDYLLNWLKLTKSEL